VFADRRYVWPMIPLCILLTGAIGGLLTLIVDRSWVAPPALRRTWQDWLLADLTGAVAPFDRITRLFDGIVWLLSC